MNGKDKKRKNTKNTREVILLKYKDTRTVILTRAVKELKESLIIKIQCNTQPVKEVNRIVVTRNEDYPIFRAQLKDRIVPQCLRDKCSRLVQHKTKQCQLRKGRKSNDESNSHNAKKRSATIPLISISDDECDGLQYDDISSGTLSSWTDDDIDALMDSTRKRMKDSDQEWKLCPRQRNSMSKKLPKQIKHQEDIKSSRSTSLNSLDTLVLEAMEVEDKQKLNTVPIENKHDRVKRRRTHEPRQSLKRKECFEINEDELPSQLNTAANSKIVNPKKQIKLEPVENKNRSKYGRDSYESKLPTEDPLKKEEQSTHQQDEAVSEPKYVIKPEAPETNNNIINQPNYLPREDQKSIVNDTTDNEIDAVITKLENDMDYSELNLNLIDIKQELYSDI